MPIAECNVSSFLPWSDRTRPAPVPQRYHGSEGVDIYPTYPVSLALSYVPTATLQL